ncbi:MAG: hypothetical protein Q9218_007423, partial [Villophora microphyllina]
MESAAIWQDNLENIDGSYHMFHNLSNSGNHQMPVEDGWDKSFLHSFFNDYCYKSHDYIKLAPKQSQMLGLAYPTFVLVKSVKDAMAADGTYAWHELRKPSHSEGRLRDNRLIRALSWPEFVEVFASDIRKRGPNNTVLRGGYIMSGRTAHGDYNLFELPRNFTIFYLSKTRMNIGSVSTSIWAGDNNITAMRAFYPEPNEMTLIIRPYGAGPDVNDNVSTWKRNGVSFDRVRDAFQQIGASAVEYVFEFLGPGSEYIHVGGFESISPTVLSTIIPHGSRKSISVFTLIIIQIGRTPKRKGTRSQKAVMNDVSAPELVQRGFQWDATKRMGHAHIAEWLHLSAFAYGGLASGSEAWNSSQIQLNMVFGSSETNSVMLRIEKAWQEFFKLEHELRVAYRKAQVPWDWKINTEPVTGNLVVHIDRDLEVKGFEKGLDGTWECNTKAFDTEEWWNFCFDKCPCLCFAMGYLIWFDSKSELLDWEKPTFGVDFNPFTRLFYTKGESQVDIKLLRDAFHDKKTELEQAIQQKLQDPQSFTASAESYTDPLDANHLELQEETSHQALNDDIQEELAFYVGSLTNGFQDEPTVETSPLNSDIAYSLHSDLFEAAPLIWHAPDDHFTSDMQRFEPEIVDLEDPLPTYAVGPSDSTLNALVNTSIGNLEADLVASNEFNQLQSLDNVFRIQALGLRDTVFTEQEPPYTAATVTNETMPAEVKLPNDLEHDDAELRDASIHPSLLARVESDVPSGRLSIDIDVEIPSAINPGLIAQSSTSMESDEPGLFIGGILIENPKLVMAAAGDLFVDVPVVIQTAAIPATSEGLLLAPLSTTLDDIDNSGSPVLVLSAAERSDVHPTGKSLTSVDEIRAVATQSSANIDTTALSTFELAGDIKQLFGISGLSGQIYTVQSNDPGLPIIERVKPNLIHSVSNPIQTLFPYIHNNVMEAIPIRDLELIYSEDRRDIINPPGLRVEADIAFEGSLQPVADALTYLLGDKIVAP